MIELSKDVTESLSESDLLDLQNEVVETYGVEEEDVIVEVIYETTGSVALENLEGISEELLESALEDEIANLLGVHENQVEVSIIDGIAYYTIDSNSVEAAYDIQDILNEPESTTRIETMIGETFPGVDVTSSVVVNPETTAQVVITVDTSGAENNLVESSSALEATFENQGYTAEAESKNFVRSFLSSYSNVMK